VQTGILFRPVGTFPDMGTVGIFFSSMVGGEVVVVGADGTGDILASLLISLCLDAFAVGHFQGLHMSRFRNMCGKNIYEAHTLRW